MPRTGDIFAPPSGTKGTPDTTIQSSKYNAFVDDITADLNAARPVTAGGTGATNALQARINLGAQTVDDGLTSISGLTTAANQMLYLTGPDLYATTALTPFVRTVLACADALAVRSIIGANDAGNLTAGTLPPGRLSGAYSFSDLTLSGGITVNGGGIYNTSLISSNVNYWFRSGGVQRAVNYWNASDSSWNTQLYDASGAGIRSFSYRQSDGRYLVTGFIQSTGDIIAGGNATLSGGNAYVNSAAGNPAVWMQRGGVTRSVQYHDGTGWIVSLNDASGNSVRSMSFNQTSGVFSVGGSIGATGTISANGAVGAGSASLATDGNIAGTAWGTGGAIGNLYNYINGNFVANGATANINVTGWAGYLRMQNSGVTGRFDYSGQGGQPTWVLGSNTSDGSQFLVWNPVNWTVANANALGGVAASNYAQFSTSGNQSETNFPLGQPLAVLTSGVSQGRREYRALYLHSTNTAYYTLATSAGAQLTGMWRQIGQTSNDTANYQRVA